MGIEEGKFLREQAERCRGLAANLTEPKISLTLCELADEYDLRAAVASAEARARQST